MGKRKLTVKTLETTAIPAFDPKAIDAGLIAQAKQHYTATFDDDPVTTLSDAEVWACIVAVKTTNPEFVGDVLLSAVADEMDSMESNDDQTTDAKPVDVAKLPAWIRSAAAKLNKDTEAIAQFQAIMDAEDTRRRGPIVLFARCLNDFAKTTTLPSGRVEYSECEMDEWPIPLSYSSETISEMKELVPAGNQFYVGKGASKKITKNNSNSALSMDLYRREGENASRYMDFVLSLDIGKKIAKEREDFRLGSLENPTGPYVSRGQKLCAEEYALRVGRLKLLAQQMRTVKTIWDQWRTVQAMDKVYPEFITVDGDKWLDDNDHSKGKVQVLTGTLKPLAIVNKAKPSVFNPMGYSSFNALKLDVAKAKGGSYDDVVTSGKKPREKGEQNKSKAEKDAAAKAAADAEVSVINWQIDQASKAMAGFSTFIANPSNAISVRQAIKAQEDLLEAAGLELVFFLNFFRTNPDLMVKFDTINGEEEGTLAKIINQGAKRAAIAEQFAKGVDGKAA
jgi:hypothetical protein